MPLLFPVHGMPSHTPSPSGSASIHSKRGNSLLISLDLRKAESGQLPAHLIQDITPIIVIGCLLDLHSPVFPILNSRRVGMISFLSITVPGSTVVMHPVCVVEMND